VAYPVHVRIEYHERRSRLSTLARAVLVVPHLAVVLLLGLAAGALTLGAWCSILATGRYPRAFFGFVAGTLRYSTRVGCYWLLVTDRFPPFGPGAGPGGDPVQVWVDEPGRRSRLTAGLRLVLAVPAWLVLYFLVVLAVVMSFVGWWIVVTTGRLPHGMFEVMELCHRYRARVSAYSLLLTDDYPWFQEESGSEPEPWGLPAAVRPIPE
jgi:hypothetical protein